MALITEDRARQIVEDEREAILDAFESRDYANELAEASTPIYNHDIYEQWGDLPSDARDQWRAYGMEVEGVVEAMRIDIHIHLTDLFQGAVARLIEESEVN